MLSSVDKKITLYWSLELAAMHDVIMHISIIMLNSLALTPLFLMHAFIEKVRDEVN